MRKIFLILLAAFVLAACNRSTTGGNGDEGSYAILAKVNGESYIYEGDEGAIKDTDGIDQQIGTIQRKLKPSKTPNELESNYFPAGSKIYSVKGTELIIIEDEESGKQILMKILKQ
ncbi:membrane lipoprotein lipid attachment site-containing protein [Domibacillus iocasae]|uniref:Lipoprotein n=1 Tax=Domibacillus iocasae TaxID=1714016 RepID=A0A1E7DQN3_9BACI|nr:membrane lipoprotein lipid attachment site-containing protein [Domibacillus iocasae]OES45364.1 hypothetical protein BA724_05005 [Domibacillus iocasae]